MSHKTEIWAHRGASEEAPENTMAAFELAVKQKADAIEIDVQVSSDGEVVICHDESLERLAGKHALVVQTPWDELKVIDIAYHRPEFPLMAMPRLAELLDLLEPTNLALNIELKNSIYPMYGLEHKCIDLTKEFRKNHRVIFSSFNHQSMATLLEIDGALEVAPLYDSAEQVDPFLYAGIGFKALHPQWTVLRDMDYVQRCKAAGLKLHPWTVDRGHELRRIFDAEPDAIITNVPFEMRLMLQKLQAEQASAED